MNPHCISVWFIAPSADRYHYYINNVILGKYLKIKKSVIIHSPSIIYFINNTHIYLKYINQL